MRPSERRRSPSPGQELPLTVTKPSIRHPLILTLDTQGQPHRWITWQHALFYYSRNMVAWDAGAACFTFRGGISRHTGLQSEITANSIIAIKGRALSSRTLRQIPPLTNRELFHRDRCICAYCGHEYQPARLTRDHIRPLSHDGADSWMNVVTACRNCNQRKGANTPEEARMMLLYAPYIPNKAEYLILSNRSILVDQMDFLAHHLPSQSRLR